MRFAIKDAGNVKVTNKATGIPIFYSEDANTFEYKFSAEAVYAKAKGENAIAFDGPTTAELKMEPRNYLSAPEAGTIPPLPELRNCLHSSGKADTGDSGENNEALHPVSEENLPSCPYFSPVNTGKADYILLP